jgi:lysine/ornithine N-monooxygenase
LIDEHHLETRHLQAQATGIEPSADGVVIHTNRGDVHATNVVLAMGNSDRPSYPAWAWQLKGSGARIDHIFDEAFDPSSIQPRERVAVIGGGITAAQTANKLGAQSHSPVMMLTRRPLEIEEFDSPSAHAMFSMSRKSFSSFQRLQDPTQRRQWISEARRPGSVPPYVMAELEDSIARGKVVHQVAEVTGAHTDADGRIVLDTPQGQVKVDRVVLATGFERSRPGGALVDDAIKTAHLPVAPDGYPLLDEHLRWHPHVFVTGGLADLQLGPTARNIRGIQFAFGKLRDPLDEFATEFKIKRALAEDANAPTIYTAPSVSLNRLRVLANRVAVLERPGEEPLYAIQR